MLLLLILAGTTYFLSPALGYFFMGWAFLLSLKNAYEDYAGWKEDHPRGTLFDYYFHHDNAVDEEI